MSRELEVCSLLEANLSPKKVLEFIKKIEKIIEPHGIVMIKDGKKILDISWYPFVTNMPHVVNSVSKTFVAITVGLCYDKKLLELDEKVVDIFPDVIINPNNKKIHNMTIKDVLTMSMGQMKNPVLDIDRDWVSALFNNPITYEPGSMFHYDSLATFLLAAIVTRKSGEKVITLLKREVFEPMSIKRAYFLENNDGIAIGGLGLFISTEGLAKTGWMLTNKGKYNGKRILSEEWSVMMISKQIDNAPYFDVSKYESRAGYGFQCWKCQNGGTRMSGLWGQMCLMMPEYNFVMAINARGSSSQPMLDIFDNTVLPALQNSEKHPATEKDINEFEDYISKLSIDFTINDYKSGMPALINNKKVKVTNNPYGVESFKVIFEGDLLLLKIIKKGKVYYAKYGHNKVLKSINNMYELFPPYYDSLSKPKEKLFGFVHPNAYCQYHWESETTAILEAIYDNEATRFNIMLIYDYNCASFEWIPLNCFTHYEHVYILGTYKD
ncbi:MAG: serine hydrolase domain-containing protein [Erysipelotrichaceae bacterium]|jgi:hypothetical protein